MQIKRISLFLIIGILFSMFLFSSNNVYANDLDFKFEIKQGGIDITGKAMEGTEEDAWNTMYDKYQLFIVGISGVAALTCLAVFIFQFIKLASVADNPQARSQVLTSIMWSGIGTVGLGSVAFFTSLFYGMLW